MSITRTRRPAGWLQLDERQVTWIRSRDRIGEVLDDYLAGEPPPEMRDLIEQLERVLATGDHVAGLLTDAC